LDNEGKLSAEQFRKALQDFVSSYGSTSLGDEARAKLKEVGGTVPEPKAAPPANPTPTNPTPANPTTPEKSATPAGNLSLPAGEYKTLWSASFDSERDGKVASGSRDTTQTPNGTGASLKAAPNNSGYFLTKMDLRPGANLGNDSWLRFLCRLEGTTSICLHSSTGDSVYEKYFRNLPQGKWVPVCFKVSDFDKCLNKPGSKPAPGDRVNSIVIFGCNTKAGGAQFWIDDLMLGDGPLPANAP
jgi:hypothetical protein